MCFICDRIEMIKNGTNPYFVKELEVLKQKLLAEPEKLIKTKTPPKFGGVF